MLLLPLLTACDGGSDDTTDDRTTDSPATHTADTEPPTGCGLAVETAEGRQVLERRISVTAAEPTAVWVACTSPDDPEERHLLESPASAAHDLGLYGLLADTAYTCTVHADCVDEPVETSFTTGIPEGLPILTASTTAGETPSGAYTLFNVQQGCAASAPIRLAIVDPQGKVRWSYVVGTDVVVDVDVQLMNPNRLHVGGGWGLFLESQSNRGVFRDIDLSGTVLLERALPDFGLGFNHHSEALADGTYLSLTTSEDTDGAETWFGVAVEQWSPDDGVVASWDTTAMAAAGTLAPPTAWERENLPGPYHANAVTRLEDELGDAFWLSIYGKKELWRVDVATGQRTHVFGATGDFTLEDPAGNRLPDRDFPYIQHGPDYTADGRVLVYDNGWGRPGFREESRVTEYQLDLANRRAVRTWSWTEPGWFNKIIGDADYLPDGHVLVTQGFSECTEQRDRDVSELVELRPPDTVVWRLTWPTSAWAVYRSERYDGCAVFANARYCPAVAARWDELVGG